MENKKFIMIDKLKSSLIGEQFSSIIFSKNQVQFCFDYNSFIMYFLPEVFKDNVKYQPKDEDYKDSLCGLIPELVSDVVLVENVSLTILFPKENCIIFNISPALPEEKKLYLLTFDKKKLYFN